MRGVLLIGCIWIVSWCCSPIIQAQSRHPGLHKTLSAYAQTTGFDGAILVAEHDSLIYRQAFGRRQRVSRAPFEPRTPSYIASLTKPMIAVLVMQLVERDRWHLDDPIGRHLIGLPPWVQPLTIRQLLSHTSGLPAYSPFIQSFQGFDNARVLQLLPRMPGLNFAPGSAFSYCNTGYVLLAEALSQHYRQPIADILQQRIFYPLGMANSFVVTPASLKTSTNRAYGTYADGSWGDVPIYTVGDAGVFSTLDDLWLWQQGVFGGQLLSSKTTLTRMTRPQHLANGAITGYGLGWFITSYGFGMSPRAHIAQPKVIHHFGQVGGFRSYLGINPKLSARSFSSVAAVAQATSRLLNTLSGCWGGEIKVCEPPTRLSLQFANLHPKTTVIPFQSNPRLCCRYVVGW